jgi:hypothetical protein
MSKIAPYANPEKAARRIIEFAHDPQPAHSKLLICRLGAMDSVRL